MPKYVILVRHGEKPHDHKKLRLTPEGRARSGALAFFFTTNPEMTVYGTAKPIAIYASKPGKIDPSHRPRETISPFSKKVKQRTNTKYCVGQEKELVHEILSNKEYDGKTIVICWEHTHMKKIAEGFGIKHVPVYPGKRFDLIYLFNFKHKKPKMTLLLQELMFDDSSKYPKNFKDFSRDSH